MTAPDDELELRRRAMQSQRWSQQAAINVTTDNILADQVKVNAVLIERINMLKIRDKVQAKSMRWISFALFFLAVQNLVLTVLRHYGK